MNFGNIFGGKNNGNNDCCCTIIWLLFLLSVCGNSCGFGGRGDCDGIMLIVLLLLICNCGCENMGGCRG